MNRIKNVIERYLDLIVEDIEFDPFTGKVIIKTFVKEKANTMEEDNENE